jgi:hypothetical protein
VELRTEISHTDFAEAGLSKVISHTEDEQADGTRRLGNLRNEWLTASMRLRLLVLLLMQRPIETASCRILEEPALRWRCALPHGSGHASELQLARATGPFPKYSTDVSQGFCTPSHFLGLELRMTADGSDHDGA